MSFKKTSEGRIFFQGTGNPAAKPQPEAAPAQRRPAPAPPTQLQIISLLRALNEKLGAAQSERDAMRAELENYRRMVEQLQGKAARGERAEQIAQDTVREMEETRRLLLELEEKTDKADKGFATLQAELVKTARIGEDLSRKHAALEKEQKTQSEKIVSSNSGYGELIKRLEGTEQKYDGLAGRIEETASQQARLMRQIEKAVEDRARFMRKIERIEETVVQTRDALSAKAMVLLTDQAVNNQNVIDELQDAVYKAPAAAKPAGKAVELAETPGDAREGAVRWSRSLQLQAAAIVLLVLGGVLAGWAVSKLQKPQFPDNGDFQITGTAEPANPAGEEKPPAEPVGEETPAPDTAQPGDAAVAPAPVPADGWKEETDTSAFNAEPAPAAKISDAADDIGTVDLSDEQKILKMLDENPDAVAAELNRIEPGAVEPAKIADSAPVAVAALTQEDTQEPAAPLDPPEPPAQGKSVAGQISPDSALPAMAKDLETQAFGGNAGAQHDLAALYVAGQAGVKQDYKRAFFWFKQAADAGVTNAAYNLGVLYHQGLGTAANLDQALKLYTKAADKGHPDANYNLGIAYIEGIGVPYDPFKAEAYFRKAADKGIMEASYNLGLIYENGLLGKPQPQDALIRYKEAADRGGPEAKEALEQLAKTLNIRVEDINTMVGNLKPAASGKL